MYIYVSQQSQIQFEDEDHAIYISFCWVTTTLSSLRTTTCDTLFVPSDTQLVRDNWSYFRQLDRQTITLTKWGMEQHTCTKHLWNWSIIVCYILLCDSVVQTVTVFGTKHFVALPLNLTLSALFSFWHLINLSFHNQIVEVNSKYIIKNRACVRTLKAMSQELSLHVILSVNEGSPGVGAQGGHGAVMDAGSQHHRLLSRLVRQLLDLQHTTCVALTLASWTLNTHNIAITHVMWP